LGARLLAWRVLCSSLQKSVRTGFLKKQIMIQTPSINFKNTGSKLKWKLDRKISLGLWIIALLVATFFYWRYLNHLTHVRVPATSSHKAPAVAVPTADELKLAAGSPKSDNLPTLAKTNSPAPATAPNANFADSLMAVISPSARAETMHPEMQPAIKPAKRMITPVVARASSGQRPLPPAGEQERLKVAQDGFDDAISLAFRNPDAYGFTSDDDLGSASLGNPIPVYMIAVQDRGNYAGQPVTSLLTPADEWVFPIILDNRIRYMVQVRYDGRNYVLGRGSRALAAAYDKIRVRWPASQGFHPRLVINPDMPFYFFTIPELPDPNMTDTSRMLDFDPVLSPAGVILTSWR
jgi:hypothetical protein